MNQKSKNYTTLIEIGGEGGSITINKKLVGDQYKYWFATNEAAMADSLDDLEGINLQSNSGIVDSFEEAFALVIKKYSIFYLYLEFIDDEVKVIVAKEFREFLEKNSDNIFIDPNWKRLLDFN